LPLNGYSTAVKYQYLGRPQKIPFQTQAGKRGELVKPVTVPSGLLTRSIYLCDFGLAIDAGTSVSYKPQSPGAWCAPERFHGVDPSSASDMWSYMVIFTKLYLNAPPWSLYGDGVPNIVKVLGPLPQNWFGCYHQPGKNSASWYDQSKKAEFTLEAMIKRNRPEVSSAERAHVLSFMLKGFHFHPKHRVTARELLSDPSFQAVMKAYGV
jgi:serine/threonine protein kinase